MVDKSEKFRWLARLGFAARGVVYTLVGYLFLTGGSGGNSGSGGAQSAFAWIQEVPGGTVILYLCALGLFGYALYRLASPAFDIENYGSDKKGVGHRIGHAASGVAHLVLAYTAFQFASGDKQSSGSGSGGGGAQEAAGTVLSVEFGSVILGIVGIGFLIAAFAQAKKAVSGDFMNRVSPRAPGFVKPLGHAGYAARAVVFAIIGWSLVQSAWISSSSQVKTLGDAVMSLRDDGIIFTLVALGLLLFGIFSLFLARYRIVPDLGPDGRTPTYRLG
ncbi:hypothetical protein GCM10011371_04940 [Novosphingobium marinum]|uniref:DUF1206 domain-containing protein n=1 Tax=Novosphingobium marinum TaxID=1514948 RepID=A0A7Y9XW49_9SPHN|nr:DUF1206 domain-containing protein [Novosphingobium marinum]NYH94183.1 hypothetical protein [Novosphingobium marinum]GGC20248.1 hypothetical protein GCM10011371_04940 [Novosphingobium marinum]